MATERDDRGSPARSNSSHYLSNATSSARKGRQVESETTSGNVDQASLSMPPPVSKLNLRYQNISPRTSRLSDSNLTSSTGPPSLRATSSQDSEESAPALLAPSSVPEESFQRRSDPDMETKRMSAASLPLYNPGKKAPSSAAGSDQDAQHSASDRATTATQTLSVTASSHNGSLSPTLDAALREPPSGHSASMPSALPSLPNAYTSKEGRTVRGRPQVSSSRRASGSNPGSASVSVERPAASEKTPPKIGTIGICALDSKARSKPSRNILNRLVGKENDFDVIIFGDKVILDEDVENWPVCDFLISFFSEGFPLDKAIAYVKLRRPFCVNDLPMQTVLWDRRICLTILDKLGVPTPSRVEVTRDGGPTLSTDISKRIEHLVGAKLDGWEASRIPQKDIYMEDDDDTLVVKGNKLSKPFVEKPVSGEDHNINIYYPKSQGGGGRKLFRKINNKSSEKDPNLTIPLAITDQEGSYIYEQFLKVENAEDVKAYTVGSEFCHAETRKSPVVDGVVKRNPNGKEIRYVTSLTKEEQVMAAKIAHGFGQRICGFDLLRVGDASYVIDVNGWSFVKDNNEYYDKCASLLKGMFLREKMRWETRATTPSEDGDKEIALPSDATSDKIASDRKPPLAVDRERGNHRTALKRVFRARSISQLREEVGKMGHTKSTRSPSGAASPIGTAPYTEQNASKQRLAALSPDSDDILPPPAMSGHDDHSTMPDHYPDGSMDAASDSRPTEAFSKTIPAPAPKSQWKLKGMVAVIRHADRTPKQKFKFTFHTKPFVDLLKGHQEEVLLVGEAALNSVQLAVKQALTEGVEDPVKLRTLQNALARKGALPGTKVQIKPMFKTPKSDKADGKVTEGGEKVQKTKPNPSDSIPLAGPVEGEDVSTWQDKVTTEPSSLTENDAADGAESVRVQSRSDSIGEVTMSRHAAAEKNLTLDKLQLVMKWGGEPTHSARYQASDLGENLRNDLLLMNKDVLHDVSIFTSSERRVTTSAQIFASAFLEQQNIDSSQIRVRKDLLDDSNAAKDEMDKVKKKLKNLLRQGNAAPEQFAWPKDGTPEPYVVVRNVVELMKFHRRVMRDNFPRLQTSEALSSLQRLSSPESTSSAADGTGLANGADSVQASAVQSRWCTGEDAELFKERWEKLFNEFTDAEKVDPSKISELYDTMKFDALHNRQFLEWVFTPSPDFLLEEGEEGEPKLNRTESLSAREEFAHTHSGSAPLNDGKDNLDAEKMDPPRRSGTSSSSLYSILAQNEKEQRSRTHHKLPFGRRSAELKAAARNAMAGQNPEDSYFNLYRGNGDAPDSKVRNDVRLEKLNELYGLSKILFDFIGPQEYGITNAEKLEIGLLTSLPLLREIVKDIEEVQASDDAKSFIYFTKESHIYTLLNCILEGGIQTKIKRNAIPELDYLSTICFELYESENDAADIDPSNPDTNFNYSIRISISPGCHTFDPLDVQLDSKHCIGFAPRRTLTPHADWKNIIETLRDKFSNVKLPTSFTAVNLSEKIPQEFAGNEAAPGLDDV